MRLIDDLKFFLATAPANWQNNQIIRRYYLSTDEGFVSCVYWNNLYFITGTDIVRCVVYRFEQLGREITDRKKFEEGVFSDLRCLKCGTDAILEPSKSPFLEFLYRNSCLRTQKKQKVFFWFSVPHDKLFTDALERDLKKEQVNQLATTKAAKDPALSFTYDPKLLLHDQLEAFVEAQRSTLSPTGEDDEMTQLSSTPVSELGSGNLSPDPIDITQQSYYIKEENGTPVLTPAGLEDDFPLDYFPQTTENSSAALLDPSVFITVPEFYDDALLIDQTLAKTPYDKRFDKREEEEEEEMAMYPTHYPPQVPMYPSRYVPQGYYHPQPQITNGQFYDAQLNGEEAYHHHHHHHHHHPQEFYVPGYYQPVYPYYETHGEYPAFVRNEEDGDDQLYDAFERPSQTSSPFGRVFPSFQATAPPQSSRSARFPKSATSVKFAHDGRVTKPSTLRQQRNIRKEPKTEVKNEDDEEYATLPTPESTAQEQQGEYFRSR